MKTVARWLTVTLLGVVLGVGSAAVVLAVGAGSQSVAVGPWRASLLSGSADADMYTRARVALFGLLALDRRETLYFVATTDSDGNALSGDCDYRVEGRDLEARWWSVTAYGSDSFLIRNPAGIYSLSRTTVQRQPDGAFALHVSSLRREANWLPVAGGKRFDLTARLYNPTPEVAASPAVATLPRIVKEGCR